MPYFPPSFDSRPMYDNKTSDSPVVGSIHGPHRRGYFRDANTFPGFITFRAFNCTGKLMMVLHIAEHAVTSEVHAYVTGLLNAQCPESLDDHGRVCPFEVALLQQSIERSQQLTAQYLDRGHPLAGQE